MLAEGANGGARRGGAHELVECRDGLRQGRGVAKSEARVVLPMRMPKNTAYDRTTALSMCAP